MILVTGGTGFLGSQVCNLLQPEHMVLPVGSNCDLRDIEQVEQLIRFTKPDMVIHLAAQVGGIGANMNAPYVFLVDNLKMNMNIIEVVSDYKIPRFLGIGSVCMYPKYAKIPFVEEDIWAGYPEETNSPYGISKRILLELCRIWDYKMIIPTNLYGPGADANLKTSHVIPALIRKCLNAKKKDEDFIVWGTGKATRDFLYVDDAARAITQAVKYYDEMPSEVNVASGLEVSISHIVNLVAEIAKFNGNIVYDTTKPDGQPRRRVDIKRARAYLDWKPLVDLRDGLTRTIEHYKVNGFE